MIQRSARNVCLANAVQPSKRRCKETSVWRLVVQIAAEQRRSRPWSSNAHLRKPGVCSGLVRWVGGGRAVNVSGHDRHATGANESATQLTPRQVCEELVAQRASNEPPQQQEVQRAATSVALTRERLVSRILVVIEHRKPTQASPPSQQHNSAQLATAPSPPLPFPSLSAEADPLHIDCFSRVRVDV